MTGTAHILHRADDRAAALRDAYRAAGFWSGDPIDVVRSSASRVPDADAVIDRDGVTSYAELDRRIDRAAATLVAAGVRSQTPVLLAVGNDLASVVAVHAVMRIDAVVLLVPLSAGRALVADIVARTGARYGVAPAAWLGDTTDYLGADCHWIDLAVSTTDDPRDTVRPVHPQRAADTPSFVLFTSGTTSKPKGVVHSAATLRKASANYIEATELTTDDRVFMVSPLASVTGVLQALFIAPVLDAPVILEDRWDPVATYELLESSGGTWYGGPDRLLDRLLDQADGRGESVPLRAVYLGGTMLDSRVVERIERDFGIVVMRAYGSSEVPISTSGLRGDPVDLRHGDDGVPLADVDVRIGSDLDPGECAIRGPHAFLGYTDPDDDDHAFVDGWYHTGDVAQFDSGRVKIVGRLRDIVIRNGLKIPVAEVEEAMNRLPGVADSAGFSVADDTTGERLVVAVIGEADAELTLAEVVAGLRGAGLSTFKLPEELVFWDRPFPLNANGKIERRALEAASQGLRWDSASRVSR